MKRDSQARALFASGNTLRSSALQINSQKKLDAVLGDTEKKLTELAFNQLDDNATVSVEDGLEQVLSVMDASMKHNSLVTGVPFGIDRLDHNTTGGQAGDLVILAARPSMEKTALSFKFTEATLNAVLASGENDPLFGKLCSISA